MNLSRAWPAMALVVFAVSGCIGGEDGLTDAAPSVSLPDPNVAADGRDLTIDLQPTDSIPGPNWKVGHWVGSHVFIGMDDTEGFHLNAVVVKDLGTKWVVASDHKGAAAYEGMFDLMFFGEFDKATLDTTFSGEKYPWYEWPLSDGKTWSRSMKVASFDTGEKTEYTVKFESKYNPSIMTEEGPRPGFDITGTTSEGKPFLEYDYVPATGWFAHYFFFDPNADEGTKEWLFHVMSMGSGEDWKGTYFVDTAKQVLSYTRDLGVDPDHPTEPAIPTAAPLATFPISGQATYVHAFVWSYAFMGVHETFLVDPANKHRQFEATSTGLDNFAFKFEELSVPAIAGDWKIVAAGGGIAAGGGALAWEIKETSTTL